ncbi:hypothetical protein BpHYR1_043075 [Brachionus plicatilis]|uniref:Uncharacterized protein n=1 Tax=Brachionus plicatilis TaxID=10195 RepID=A0A3M7RXF1_BRAPC|nr:hypothetical protein BpHYR1_043075 [Brachionus plicatilis]
MDLLIRNNLTRSEDFTKKALINNIFIEKVFGFKYVHILISINEFFFQFYIVRKAEGSMICFMILNIHIISDTELEFLIFPKYLGKRCFVLKRKFFLKVLRTQSVKK